MIRLVLSVVILAAAAVRPAWAQAVSAPADSAPPRMPHLAEPASPPPEAGTATSDYTEARTVRVGESVHVTVDFPIGDVASGQGQRFFRIAMPDSAEGAGDLYEVVLVGREVGRDSLVLYDAAGIAQRRLTIIVVQPSSIDRCAEDVQAMLEGIPQVKVKALNTRVLVDGLALTPDIRERVGRIIASYTEGGECPVLALLDKSALYEREVERAVNDELQAMGIRTIAASVRSHRLILKGAVTTKVEAELATKLASSYYTPLTNMIVIKPEMSLKEAAWEARRALKGEGYDLFVFAKDKRIYVEGIVSSAEERSAIEDIARANAGPHGAKIIVRVMTQ